MQILITADQSEGIQRETAPSMHDLCGSLQKMDLRVLEIIQTSNAKQNNSAVSRIIRLNLNKGTPEMVSLSDISTKKRFAAAEPPALLEGISFGSIIYLSTKLP